ncbi:MAG: hypothetical protein O2783_01675 [Chloroflexi bacterium]|nr:hypothetical protein [Chloroflexota bacterium]
MTVAVEAGVMVAFGVGATVGVKGMYVAVAVGTIVGVGVAAADEAGIVVAVGVGANVGIEAMYLTVAVGTEVAVGRTDGLSPPSDGDCSSSFTRAIPSSRITEKAPIIPNMNPLDT